MERIHARLWTKGTAHFKPPSLHTHAYSLAWICRSVCMMKCPAKRITLIVPSVTAKQIMKGHNNNSHHHHGIIIESKIILLNIINNIYCLHLCFSCFKFGIQYNFSYWVEGRCYVKKNVIQNWIAYYSLQSKK